MVPEQYWREFAIQFQIAHAMTWARFQAAVGINDLPLSRAFFSGVSVDNRIRKSPTECTKSPSNQKEEPDGVELTIKELLKK